MSRSPLPLLLDFDTQYQRDRDQTPAFLHRRDRRLALAREEAGAEPPSVAEWLHAVNAGHHDPAPLRRWRRATLAFTGAGAVLGVLTMLGLLYVTGPARINVTLFVALALLQLLLALATAGQALAGWRPWGGLFDRDRHGAPVLRQLQPQLAARAAQAGGLAFALTALATLLAQVLVRDLAFGWSTTLQTSAPAYQQLMDALAWPWRAWLPAAVPGPDLVAQSRYFRLEGGTPADPALLGGWWPFLTLLWLCYVVLPRLALLALSRWHLNRRARRLLRDHPGYAALGERFATPWVDSGADEPPGPAPARVEDTPAPPPPDHAGTLIRWAGADHPALPQRPDRVLDAGGSASLEQDRDALNRADPTRPVWLLVRAWEPPTGDLADFLDDARAHWGPDTVIALLPLTGDAPTAALAPWQRFAARREDPALRLCAPPAPVSEEARP
ncbi:MAG: hypothetical protein CL543_10795 [Alcanivorax sp.]|nr:hypothetical protein [Alcanivorax sp.]MBM1142550.1 DUF2868 domain-containing protein [Alcanivorax sp. ZXX171]UWN50304.1 hypothetical protein ASALC70_02525 [Alcanivorax sp. ALC70]MBI55346.1 hypothetical protein [Alcanivorax sp.]MBU59356.1 hypothetical protein [Alcanivorax sp.]